METIQESGHLVGDSFGSVIMPRRLAVHKFCDEQNIHARRFGAINSLIVEYDSGRRRFIGDNTEWSDLYALIKQYATVVKSAPGAGLVTGASGASRDDLYAMYQAGIRRVFLVNRTICHG